MESENNNNNNNNNLNLVRNGGGFKLPIGFRFRPTDEELLVHYLKRKVYSFPLPAFVILDHFNVFRSNPWDLPGDLREKRYFFSKRKGNEKKWNRVSGTGTTTSSSCSAGYWKVMGKEKQIVAPGTNQLLGMKKKLVFYQGRKHAHAHAHAHGQKKTCWLMNEYRLLHSQTTTPMSPHHDQFDMQKCLMEMEDWVVCLIYEKKRKAKINLGFGEAKTDEVCNINKSRNMDMIKPTLMDFMMVQDSTDMGPPQPSSSSSCSTTGIAELSSNGSDQEASSSSASLCFPSHFWNGKAHY